MSVYTLKCLAVLAGFLVFSSAVQGQTRSEGPLEISTVERPPFTFYDEDGGVSGFSVELWEEISERNGWEFVWKLYDSFPAMIDGVVNGEADAAIANISLTSERERILDFSYPIYDSGLQIVVSDQKGGSGIIRIIWQSGAIQLIGGAIIILLIIAHILWFFERNTPNSRHDYFRDDYLGGVWDAFWWAFIIMTMGGFEKEVPASKFSRFLAMFWIVASLFFVSTLTAKITTSLTVDQLSGDINSVSDLVGKRVGAGENSAMSRFLEARNIPYRKYEDFNAALAALENNEIVATIGDAPIVRYYVANDGAGKVALAGPVFQADKFAIAFPDGSQLLERVNMALLQIREDGTYERLRAKWFGSST